MKKMIKYMMCGVAALSMASCGDLYETHKEYLEMGETVYVGLADSLKANGGFNRVELKWKLNADPKISKCEITWNGCTEPLVVAADRSQEYQTQIVDVPEGKYTFKVVVKSESGEESLAQTVAGESYGINYQTRLPQKAISSIDAMPEGATINWMAEEGCVGVHLEYTNINGEKKSLEVEGDATTTFIEDFVPGTTFVQTSLFKPEENAIDNIASLPTDREFPSYYVLSKEVWESTYKINYVDLDRSAWAITADTQEAGGEGPVNGYVAALADGDYATFWHSAWSNGAAPALPHVIDFDMQESKDIAIIELARRPNNKDTKTVVFSISEDQENWTVLGQLTFPNNVNPNSKILMLPKAASGRYVRASVTECNNSYHASISEIIFSSPK